METAGIWFIQGDRVLIFRRVLRAFHTDFGMGGDPCPPHRGGGTRVRWGGLARDSRQDQSDQKNECKPMIMSKILIYQHNNVMNGSLIQLPMILFLKI